jgi:hypothetical protein
VGLKYTNRCMGVSVCLECAKGGGGERERERERGGERKREREREACFTEIESPV